MTKKKTAPKNRPQAAPRGKAAKAKAAPAKVAPAKAKKSKAEKPPAKPAAKSKKSSGVVAAKKAPTPKKTPAPKAAVAKKPAKAVATTSQPSAKKPQRTAAERQKLIAKLHKVLKTHYSPRLPDTSRPLLEQVLFACCLENADYDAAEKAFTQLLENSFDLNEVRVTTVAELAEVLVGLPDPSKAALSLRRALQAVFESSYSFSLDQVKKQSVSQGVKSLEGLQSLTPFVQVYITSTALGGHGIPLDQGGLTALYLTGIISQDDYEQGAAPGLDRLVTKKIGKEFGSLLHHFGADLIASLHGVKVKKILGEITSEAKDRMPKRGESLPPPVAAAVTQADPGVVPEAHRPAGPQAAARPAGKTPQPPPGSGPKRDADGKPIGPRSGPKPFVVKPNMARSITIKPELAAKREAAEKAAADAASKGKAKTGSGKAKPAGGKSKKQASAASSTHSQKLAKKKPR
jgi:endonuclease-3